MEVGAVKQAFNTEVILLKKNLNRAKLHVIHKLTRKAKALTEKKAPEHLKEKLKRKAESAVNEVLLIKKIKSKDIAKFIITHTGDVKDYLNRPGVDNDKACARLVLHKSLEDKYSFIRNRFGNVAIKDLFMSREERRKLKKEARDQQKNKKKGKKGKNVNAARGWDVEDVEMSDNSKNISRNEIDNVGKVTNDDSEDSEAEINDGSDDKNDSEVEDQDIAKNNVDEDHNSQSDNDKSGDEEAENDNKGNDERHDDDDEHAEVGKYIKLKPGVEKSVEKVKPQNVTLFDVPEIDNFKPQNKQMDRKVNEMKKAHKKVKDNKNKNLKEKLQHRTFKKDEDDSQVQSRKVVDTFFITATGENYLSSAEPRQPDEVKVFHRQGNRKERRAALFGLDIRPKRDHFRQNNFRSGKFDGQDANDRGSTGGYRNNNDRFNNDSSYGDRNSKFNDRSNKFGDRNSNFNDRSNKFGDRYSNFNDRNKFNEVNNKFNNRSLNNDNDDKNHEKLHPSWEAKKKLKSAMSLLPAQGKKIVFNDG